MQAALECIATSLQQLVASHGRQVTELWVTNDQLCQHLEQKVVLQQPIAGPLWPGGGSVAGPEDSDHALSDPQATHAPSSSFSLVCIGLPLWGLVTSFRDLLYHPTMYSI